MKRTVTALGLAAALLASGGFAARAMPFFVNATATIVQSGGSYSGDLDPGIVLNANIALSTDEADAASAVTTPSTVPGHEFTSFYEFSNATFSWVGTVPSLGGSFVADTLGIVVNDNLSLTAADTGGVVPDGTYDWIELLGSTTVDVCLVPGGVCGPDEFSPADGEEWTLAILGAPDWFSDGSVIPDGLPASFSMVLVGNEFDASGNEIGFVIATIDTFETDLPTLSETTVPAPASAGLVGLFLLAAAAAARRRTVR